MGNTPLIIGVDRNSTSVSQDLKTRLSKMPLKFKDGDNTPTDEQKDNLDLAINYVNLLEMRNMGIFAFNNRFKKALAEAFENGVNILEDGVIKFSAEGIESVYEKMSDELLNRGFNLGYNEITGNFEVKSGKFLLEDSVRKIQSMQMQRQAAAMQQMQEMQKVQSLRNKR